MRNDPSDLSALTEELIGSAITVHRLTGPGLLESVYKACLLVELRGRGLLADTERVLPLFYKKERLELSFRADMVVENVVLVEVKAVDTLKPVHMAQVITYLTLTGCPVGLLLNFNVTALRDGIRRLLNPSIRAASRSADKGVSEGRLRAGKMQP